MDVTVCTATSDTDLQQILDLQYQNHFSVLPAQQAAQDGFVTVRHSLPLLKEMNRKLPQVIAKSHNQVVGYALVMPSAFQNLIPVLKPMFHTIQMLDFQGEKLSQKKFYVMGQICIADQFRGIGLFDKLYHTHKTLYATQFDICVTEVSARNIRSMRAHERVGFKTLKTFQDQTDIWNILVWDWS
jgi:hypothetical protein